MAEQSLNSGPFGFLPRDPTELHAFLADLRENKPVYQIPPVGVWAITRYDDVVHVLKHHELFSSEALRYMGMGMAGGERGGPAAFETELSSDNAAVLFRTTPTVISADPPLHGHLRDIVNRGFTPSQIERIAPRIQEITDALLDDIVARGDLELMADLAIPLPVTVIAELLGVAPERGDDFKRWSDLFISTLAQMPDAETFKRIERAMQEFADYFSEVIKARKKDPQDDLISTIVHADTPEGTLSDVQILAFCRLLLIAGNETTTNLIARMVGTLLDHPEQFAKLRTDLSLLPNAVEETLRYAGIVPTLPRLTTQDVEVGGVKIPAGQIVMPFFMAANRDPRRFPEPDRYDITRKTTGHLGFGFGAHFCLGAHLARLETRIAMEGIIRRLPNLRLIKLSQETHVLTGEAVSIHLGFDTA
jgi:cytochrome P450